MIIAKRFKSNKDVVQWLTDESALKNLEKEYPRDMYATKLNLQERLVEVEMRQLRKRRR